MSYEEMRTAYDEDLKKYGYVRQSTINSFTSQQVNVEPIKKLNIGTSYLWRIHEDIKEYWIIRNDTVNAIIGYIQPKKNTNKKKMVKKKIVKTKKEYLKDSYIYHRIFEKHYGCIKYCMRCWSLDRLQIHHKDKNHKNNDVSNLIKLCYKCHCLAHKWDRVYRLMIKKI